MENGRSPSKRKLCQAGGSPCFLLGEACIQFGRLEGWKVGAGQMQSADGGARRAHAGSPVVVVWCTDRDPGQHRDA